MLLLLFGHSLETVVGLLDHSSAVHLTKDSGRRQHVIQLAADAAAAAKVASFVCCSLTHCQFVSVAIGISAIDEVVVVDKRAFQTSGALDALDALTCSRWLFAFLFTSSSPSLYLLQRRSASDVCF